MKVKVLSPILKPGGGAHQVGAVIDVDSEFYDRHLESGAIVSVIVADAVAKAEAEVARVRAKAEADVIALEKAAREAAASDVANAKADAADARKKKLAE